MPIEAAITRQSVTNEKDRDNERTMGRKHVVPYGLYLAHGYVNAPLAEKNEGWGEGAGMTEDDLALLWTGLRDMFEHDRSASRGAMVARRGIAFKHASKLGNARAHELFERVAVSRVVDGETIGLARPEDRKRLHNLPPARAFSDYRVDVDREGLPDGVEVIEFC
jgi:CRISPR-associated protein Csd2